MAWCTWEFSLLFVCGSDVVRDGKTGSNPRAIPEVKLDCIIKLPPGRFAICARGGMPEVEIKALGRRGTESPLNKVISFLSLHTIQKRVVLKM
ncbi:MAG: hypothetical protein ACOCW1_04765 [Chitinispirillaceae bacterium]